jgi:hypothetical protein
MSASKKIIWKGILRYVFIRVDRLEIHSVMLVFLTSFLNCWPTNVLSGWTLLTPPLTCVNKYMYLTAVLRIRIRDPVPFWPLDPGSGIGFFRIPDLGSRIPNSYFWELSDNFLGKKYYNSLKIDPNFFLQHFKSKIIQFCEIYGSKKKGMTTNFFSPLSFIAVFGSGIRDPRSGIRDPGSGIRDG